MRRAVLAAVLAGALALGPRAARAAAPTLLTSYSDGLYLRAEKIGYRMVSLHALDGGGRRLEINTFLKRRAAGARADFYRLVKLDVGPRGEPLALECRVTRQGHRWEVTGNADGDVFRMTRRTGDAGSETTAEVDLADGVTFRSWAVWETARRDLRPGMLARYRVIDEDLGGVLPEPMYVQHVGTKGIPDDAGGMTAATALAARLGAESRLVLLDAKGRALRTVWQSCPMTAVRQGAGEAPRFGRAGATPPVAEIDGLAADRYRSKRLGYELYVPPYPLVPHVAPDVGWAEVRDMTEPAWARVRPALDPRQATLGAEPDEAELQALAERVAALWAEGYDAVTAEPPQPATHGGHPARVVTGTARLGCSTIHFRHVLLVAHGFSYLLTAARADQPVSDRRILTAGVQGDARFLAPEGQVPVLVRGDQVRIPYYGLQLRLPSREWVRPARRSGPETVLELARRDRTAVALVRAATPTAGDAFADYVADQAERVEENLGLEGAAPTKATLGGRDALQLVYTGNVLSGEPATCRILYTPVGDRVLALVLMAKTGAADAAAELEALRASLRLDTPGGRN